MLGAHGVDDIALMGFQQSIDGVRKRTYWPPIFDQAPWWPFYPEFRDACARSVALASLGKRIARYAILYPQNQLEQTDLFNIDIFSGTDPASRMIKRLGLAVYESGEIFEFVFPEILDQARVADGKIVFPNADYDAILAPLILITSTRARGCSPISNPMARVCFETIWIAWKARLGVRRRPGPIDSASMAPVSDFIASTTPMERCLLCAT